MNRRRDFLAAAAAGTATHALACGGPSAARAAPAISAPPATASAPHGGARAFVGPLSGKRIALPDVDRAPMPELAPSGVVHDGVPLGAFGIDGDRGHPDVRSFRRKFGLVIPATNTSMEHELWTLLVHNREQLAGVGIHTVNVVTPRPRLETAADLEAYKVQFVGGLATAVDQAKLARPEYMIMGMSLEHVLRGLAPVRDVMRDVEARSGLAWAAWHDAAPAALAKLGARRIGLLTPFDATGNDNARRLFEDLGFEVVSTFGFACAGALDIAHVPDEAKARAIRERLAKKGHRLDAVVQCGTNMSMLGVTERLESELEIPVLGINAVTFWYALRENGFDAPLRGGGRLLRHV